jgi:DNA-binding protein H-NS
VAQTYSQIAKQLTALQAKAEKLRRQEVGGVIAKIKVAISAYGITAKQLFETSVVNGAAKSAKASGSPKYSDGAGNVWGGRGPRPLWLRDAVARGKQLTDFLVGGQEKGNGVARVSELNETASAEKSAVKTTGTRKLGSKQAATKKALGAPAQYTDGTNRWSGRGPKPRWLKDAIAGGRSLDELRAQ